MDAQTKRVIQVLNGLLRIYTIGLSDIWDLCLPKLEFVYNCTPNRVVGASTFEIDIGYVPNEPTLDTTWQMYATHFTAAEYNPRLKYIALRTHDYLIENEISMQLYENPKRREVTLQA